MIKRSRLVYAVKYTTSSTDKRARTCYIWGQTMSSAVLAFAAKHPEAIIESISLLPILDPDDDVVQMHKP